MVNSTRPDNTVTRFQKRWPSYAEFAADAGVNYGTAQVWRHRNSIPGDYDLHIAHGAARRGLGSVDAVLVELANMRVKVKS